MNIELLVSVCPLLGGKTADPHLLTLLDPLEFSHGIDLQAAWLLPSGRPLHCFKQGITAKLLLYSRDKCVHQSDLCGVSMLICKGFRAE